MSYKFYYSQGYSQHHDLLYVTERHSHTKVAYFSKHRMNEKYPGGGYEIIGEIGNFAKECATQDTILVVNRSNVDLAIQKIKELREGHYITEVKKQELINRLLLFKNR